MAESFSTMALLIRTTRTSICYACVVHRKRSRWPVSLDARLTTLSGKSVPVKNTIASGLFDREPGSRLPRGSAGRRTENRAIEDEPVIALEPEFHAGRMNSAAWHLDDASSAGPGTKEPRFLKNGVSLRRWTRLGHLFPLCAGTGTPRSRLARKDALRASRCMLMPRDREIVNRLNRLYGPVELPCATNDQYVTGWNARALRATAIPNKVCARANHQPMRGGW
jgi:hypothetical protein